MSKQIRRARRPRRPAYRVLVGRTSASGKLYGFHSHTYTTAGKAMAAAQKTLSRHDDRLRQVNIVINPEAL